MYNHCHLLPDVFDTLTEVAGIIHWWVFFSSLVASNSAADEGNMDQARGLGKASLWVSVAGVIMSVILAIIVIALIMSTPGAY